MTHADRRRNVCGFQHLIGEVNTEGRMVKCVMRATAMVCADSGDGVVAFCFTILPEVLHSAVQVNVTAQEIVRADNLMAGSPQSRKLV